MFHKPELRKRADVDTLTAGQQMAMGELRMERENSSSD